MLRPSNTLNINVLHSWVIHKWNRGRLYRAGSRQNYRSSGQRWMVKMVGWGWWKEGVHGGDGAGVHLMSWMATYVRNWAQGFTHLISFDHHNTLRCWQIPLSFYLWVKWGSENLSNSAEATELVSGGVGGTTPSSSDSIIILFPPYWFPWSPSLWNACTGWDVPLGSEGRK